MPTEQDIRHQFEQLREHRQNAQLFLRQARAYGGVVLAPLQTQRGLADAYAGIAHCKTVLRDLPRPRH